MENFLIVLLINIGIIYNVNSLPATQVTSNITFQTTLSSITTILGSTYPTTSLSASTSALTVISAPGSCWVRSKFRGFSANAVLLNYQCFGSAASQCYPSCPAGYTGLGPVCWGSCPKDKFSCGVALCTDNAVECTKEVIEMIKSTMEEIDAAITIVSDPIKFVIDTLNLALAFTYPICSASNQATGSLLSILLLSIGGMGFLMYLY